MHHPGGDDAPFTPVAMHYSCGQRAQFAAAYSLIIKNKMIPLARHYEMRGGQVCFFEVNI